jgi:ribonuclease HI
MDIYTDGGCERNGQSDAIGAWAFVASDGYEDCAVERCTTNNRMELLAVIRAIQYAKERGVRQVTIHTDSQMTMLCALGRWKRRANLDLWEDYERTCAGLKVGFRWVRGHSGVPGNERADELCSIAMQELVEPPPEVAHLRSILRGA